LRKRDKSGTILAIAHGILHVEHKLRAVSHLLSSIFIWHTSQKEDILEKEKGKDEQVFILQ